MIIYKLPLEELGELGHDHYEGAERFFLASHTGFTKGQTVFWFDPEKMHSCFCVIHEFQVGFKDENQPVEVIFILQPVGTNKPMFVSTIDHIVRIHGIISLEATWIKDYMEIDIADTRVVDKRTELGFELIEVFNEDCGHYH